MNTDKLLRILEGSLAEHKADLAQAEDEAEGAKEAIDFTQTLIDLVRDKHEGLPVTERDEVVSWFKYRNGTFTTTLGEVRSVEEYDALVAKQRRRDRAAKEGPCDRCSVVHGEHTGGDHSFKAQEGTVKAPESPAEGLEPFFPTPTKGAPYTKRRPRQSGCF